MKKSILFSLFLLFCITVMGQIPDAFNYQAAARDAAGNILALKNVSFKISILTGSAEGTMIYSETHTATTNSFGLVNLKIGKGTVVSGIFSPGGWGLDSHFLKVEMDPTGGSTYIHLGTTQLLSVPYAFHAQTVHEDKVTDADADPLNEIQKLNISGTVLTLDKNGGSVTLPTSGTGGDNWGTQTVVNDATLTGNGTTSAPLGVVNAEIQPTWSNVRNKPAGFADDVDDVIDADSDAGNEIQTISISGTVLTLSKGGGTVTLPTSGTGGDNWGTQAVVTDATLSGNGTTSSPLGTVNSEIQPTWSNVRNKPAGFADDVDDVIDDDSDAGNEIQTISISGTELTLSKGGGTVTLPSSGGGDNWGTQTVVTDATLTGNGTTSLPLGVVNFEIQPIWVNVQNKPSGFADDVDDVIDDDSDAGNEIQTISISGTELTLSKGGGTVTLPSSGGGDNWGTQSVVTNATLSGNGTTASPLGVVGDLTDDQTLSLTGNDLSISGGNTVSLPSSASLWSESGENIYRDNGNVGIGNTSPAIKLDVTGDGHFSGRLGVGINPGTLATVLSVYGNKQYGGIFENVNTGISATGISGSAIGGGGTNRIGVVGVAENGNSNIGVRGYVSSSGSQNIGLSGYAVSGDINMGVYGYASLANNNWAGYFEGKGYFKHGLGIGTEYPDTQLDVVGQIKIRGGSPGSGKVLTSDATGLATWQTPSGSLWQTNNTSIYYNGGSVGIGVDNPASRLHVYNTEHSQIRVQSGAQDALLYLDKGATNRFASVIFRDSQTTKFYAGLLTTNNYWVSTSTISLNGLEIAENGNIKFSDNLDIGGTIQVRGGGPLAGKVLSCDNTGLASWVTMDDTDWTKSGNNLYSAVSGNIGIGKSNPVYKLDVQGNSQIRLSKPTGQWIAMRTDGSLLDLSFSGSSLAIQGSAAGENIVLNPTVASKVGIRMWIPSYELDVNGNIRATGSVYYGGSAGNANGTAYVKPDFVFDEDYDVLNTEEVSVFLENERHLPWITSAEKEKEENGDVVDMTRMAFESLEAIENLQLQMIEQQKLIRAQGEAIEVLKREISLLKSHR